MSGSRATRRHASQCRSKHDPYMGFVRRLRPALFMHGRNDPRATLDEGRRVFDAVSGPKEFVTFDNTGHESYCVAHSAEWRKAVEGIIRRAENKPDARDVGKRKKRDLKTRRRMLQ